MMNVREVAAYLNIKERKVYALVQQGAIPASRVAGKWLFPQHLVDAWVADGIGAGTPARSHPAPAVPPVVAGSHDPLLEWSLRESGCGLALMSGGSLDGLRRLAAGEAVVCGLHVLEPETGDYNVDAARRLLGALDFVLVEWAWRRQGLLTAPGNPLGLASVADLRDKRPRLVLREEAAGTTVLLAHLLAGAGIAASDLNRVPRVARSQSDVGLAILEGRADAGLGVEAVARQMRLAFLPLQRERFDLALRRRDYFEPPFQRLLAFTREPAFAERAEALGYDVRTRGRIHHNAP